VVPTFLAEVSARKNQPYWQSMSAVSIAVSTAVSPFLSHPKVNIHNAVFLKQHYLKIPKEIISGVGNIASMANCHIPWSSSFYSFPHCKLLDS